VSAAEVFELSSRGNYHQRHIVKHYSKCFEGLFASTANFVGFYVFLMMALPCLSLVPQKLVLSGRFCSSFADALSTHSVCFVKETQPGYRAPNVTKKITTLVINRSLKYISQLVINT